MIVDSWKLGFLDSSDPTPRRMLGWNIVSWNDDEQSYQVRKWVKANLQKGTYRLSYQGPECLMQNDEDVAFFMLRWK